LGSEQADLDVEVGIKACLDVILKAGPESKYVQATSVCGDHTNVVAFSDSGKFRNIHVEGWETNPNGGVNFYDGKEVVSSDFFQPDSGMDTDVLSRIALVDWIVLTSKART
jgi:hypothetical protein